MAITTIIFDFGNVVFTNDWHYDCPEKFREFSDCFGISEEEMERGWISVWEDFKLGKIDEDEFWTGFLKAAGAKGFEVSKAKELYRKYQDKIEDMPSLVRKMAERYKVGALTTISKEWLDFKLERFALQDAFEEIVSSGYSGMAKPDPRVYELVLKRLRAEPHECVFIDDKERCLLPARRIGMKTILFRGQDDLEKELNKLL